MDKQQILDEINQTKEHLANMEKMLTECENKRYKPNKNENYFTVGSDSVLRSINLDEDTLNMRYNFYNCFQTKEQAELEFEKILVRRNLEDIAKRLNKGEKINWNTSSQPKYYLEFNHSNNKLGQHYNECCQAEKVYCLDKSFKDVAIQEIGEERLIKYLKSE